MIAQTYVRFESPITLDLRRATGEVPHTPKPHTCDKLKLIIHMDAVRRTISAHLPPVPGPFVIYGPDDFAAACPDSMEELAARVLQLLGSDPASKLQGLINGVPIPLLERIPREIPNWRAKAILTTMGLKPAVDEIIATLPEPERTVVSAAWNGDAKLARNGATVTALGAALGMSEEQIDELFINAEAITI